MNTLKTYHYKLKPNKTQKSVLSQWLGTCLYQKITNIRKDFLDKVSTKLISENQAIVVEDLQISNLVQNPKPILNESGKEYKKNGTL